jgi:uncharacterized integral membrane protein (TIGR00698 family)
MPSVEPVPSHRSRVVPGLALCCLIATASLALQRVVAVPLLSPLLVSIVAGMCLRLVLGALPDATDGIVFAARRVSRVAIVMLGAQITVHQIVQLGLRGVLIVAVSLAATFVFTKWLGRVLGVERRLAELIAAGTSICGASAIVAMNAVTSAGDEDVATAIGCVTIFGCVGAIAYPGLFMLLPLGAQRYGLWAGSSLHELAQVVAAALAVGPGPGAVATTAKLLRVVLLVPMVLFASVRLGKPTPSRSPDPDRPTSLRRLVPWFLVGFVAVIAANSLGAIPAPLSAGLRQVALFLLAVALAGTGLLVQFDKLASRGIGPVALTALASLFISLVSLEMIVTLE